MDPAAYVGGAPTLAAAVERALLVYGERPCLCWPADTAPAAEASTHHHTLTFAAVFDRARSLSAELQRLVPSLHPTSHVGILGANCPAWLLSDLACALAPSLLPVGLHPHWPEAELSAIVADLDLALLVVTEAEWRRRPLLTSADDEPSPAAAARPVLPVVLVSDDHDEQQPTVGTSSSPRLIAGCQARVVLSWSARAPLPSRGTSLAAWTAANGRLPIPDLGVVLAGPSSTDAEQLHPLPGQCARAASDYDWNARFSVMYTSGSSGQPKGIVISRARWFRDARAAPFAGHVDPVVLSHMPLAHGADRGLLWQALFAGARIAFPASALSCAPPASPLDLIAHLRWARPTLLLGLSHFWSCLYARFRAELARRAGPAAAALAAAPPSAAPVFLAFARAHGPLLASPNLLAAFSATAQRLCADTSLSPSHLFAAASDVASDVAPNVPPPIPSPAPRASTHPTPSPSLVDAVARVTGIEAELLREYREDVFGGRVFTPVTGGARTPKEVLAWMAAVFLPPTASHGAQASRVKDAYGTTEFPGIAVNGEVSSDLLVRLRTADSDISTRDSNQMGELEVRRKGATGPPFSYWRHGTPTAHPPPADCWYSTGDVVRLTTSHTGEHFVEIVDRTSRLLELYRNGRSVFCRGDVVAGAVVGRVPGVRHALVYADRNQPSPLLLVDADASSASSPERLLAAVQAHLRAHAASLQLAAHEMPAGVVLAARPWSLATGELTSTGKPRRHVILDEATRGRLDRLYAALELGSGDGVAEEGPEDGMEGLAQVLLKEAEALPIQRPVLPEGAMVDLADPAQFPRFVVPGVTTSALAPLNDLLSEMQRFVQQLRREGDDWAAEARARRAATSAAAEAYTSAVQVRVLTAAHAAVAKIALQAAGGVDGTELGTGLGAEWHAARLPPPVAESQALERERQRLPPSSSCQRPSLPPSHPSTLLQDTRSILAGLASLQFAHAHARAWREWAEGGGQCAAEMLAKEAEGRRLELLQAHAATVGMQVPYQIWTAGWWRAVGVDNDDADAVPPELETSLGSAQSVCMLSGRAIEGSLLEAGEPRRVCLDVDPPQNVCVEVAALLQSLGAALDACAQRRPDEAAAAKAELRCAQAVDGCAAEMRCWAVETAHHWQLRTAVPQPRGQPDTPASLVTRAMQCFAARPALGLPDLAAIPASHIFESAGGDGVGDGGGLPEAVVGALVALHGRMVAERVSERVSGHGGLATRPTWWAALERFVAEHRAPPDQEGAAAASAAAFGPRGSGAVRALEAPLVAAAGMTLQADTASQSSLRWLTYGQLDELTRRVARVLRGLAGVAMGDVVVVSGWTSIETVVLDVACARAGLRCVGLHTTLPLRSAAYILQHAQAKVLCTPSDLWSAAPDGEGWHVPGLVELAAGGRLRHVVVVDAFLPEAPATDVEENVLYVGRVLADRDGGVWSLPALVAEEDTEEAEERVASPAPAEMFTLLYTSGSTGLPKGVVVTQEAFARDIGQTCFQLPLVTASYIPLSHSSDRLKLWNFLVNGGRVGLLYYNPSNWKAHETGAKKAGEAAVEERGDGGHLLGVDRLFAQVARLAPTHMSCPPRVWHGLWRLRQRVGEGAAADALVSALFGPRLRVVITGGAATPAWLAEWAAALVCDQAGFHESYGATEAGAICEDGFACVVAGAGGQVRVQIRLAPIDGSAWVGDGEGWLDEVADGDADANVGVVGEVVVHSPLVAGGYWGEEAEGKGSSSFVTGRDGRRWWRSGDVAVREAAVVGLDGATMPRFRLLGRLAAPDIGRVIEESMRARGWRGAPSPAR